MKVGSMKGSIHRNRRLSRKKEKFNTSRKQCENYQKTGCENVKNKTKKSEKTNGLSVFGKRYHFEIDCKHKHSPK